MNTNHPEKPFFDQAIALLTEIDERKTDLKAVYSGAKAHGAIGKDGLKTLKAAVKRHMEDPDKRAAREELESDAEALLRRLGQLAGSPLGDATLRA
jgi:hypothetical protein